MKDALNPFRTVLVLGGRSAIGLACVESLAPRGLHEVILGVRNDWGTPLPSFASAKVATEQFDADTGDVETSIARIFEARGEIDLVILAFGLLGDRHDQTEQSNVRDVMRTSGFGAVRALNATVHALRRQGHGTAVVLSSVAALRPRRSNFVYGAAKAALDAFAQGLQLELADSEVRVLIVRPGFVHSPMTTGLSAAPFATTPESVGAAVAKALETNAPVVYVPRILRFVMTIVGVLPAAALRRA